METMGGYLFITGVAGLFVYGAFRFFEVRRTRRLLEPLRARFDVFSARLYRLFVFGEIPTTYRAWLLKALRAFTHRMVVVLVALLRAIERPLSRLNHRLRTPRVDNTVARDPSPFLKQIQSVGKEHSQSSPDSVESKPENAASLL